MTQEVFKYLQPGAAVPIDMETTAMLVNALRQAIAKIESQEPLGYITIGREVLERVLKALWLTANPESEKAILDILQALATQPPQGTWVGLTKQQRNNIEDICEMIIGEPAFDAIEAQLKENNAYKENE
jgi:hypothetical protein